MTITPKEIYNKLFELCELIKNEKDDKVKYFAVGKFNDIIFNYDDTIGNEEIDDILIELAYDLEYYSPFESGVGFFGDDGFFGHVNPVLKKLRECLNIHEQ